MSDLIFVSLAVVFFAVSLGLIALCRRLMED
jgi:hypothetical protein